MHTVRLDFGMNWAREFTEQSLDQSKVALDGLFNMTRTMAEEFDEQVSAIREHSTSLTEKTLSNTFDFGHKLARLKEPHELVELQTEFISRQFQVVADQTKELDQKIRKGTEKLASITTGVAVKLSAA